MSTSNGDKLVTLDILKKVRDTENDHVTAVQQEIVDEIVGYDHSLTKEDFASLEIVESKFTLRNGWASSSNTWLNVNENYKHIIIPVHEGDTFSYNVSSSSSNGCAYVGLNSYSQPEKSGDVIQHISESLPYRNVVAGGTTGQNTVPEGCHYLCLSIYALGSIAVFDDFTLISKSKGQILNKIDGKVGSVYVSGTGNDSTGDGSYENPYRSIQKAIESGEQHVCVKPGVMSNGVYSAYSYAPFGLTGRTNPLTINMYDMPEYSYIKGATYKDAGTRVEPKIVIDQSSRSSIQWHGVSFKNVYAPITLNDIEVKGPVHNVKETYAGDISIRHCFNFENCSTVDLNRCFASYNTTDSYSGFHYSNTSGVLRDCVAHNVHMDGFNFHSGGNTQLINCKANNCADDGVSHHDGCTGVVIGGQFNENGKGGISSPFGGSIVDIVSAYCHNNQYGVYSASPSPTSTAYARPKNQLRINNCVLKGNTSKDIYMSQVEAVGWGNLYDSKFVNQETGTGKQATFTEYQ